MGKGIIARLKRKPMWKVEQERRRKYERLSAEIGYETASAKRNLELARKEAEAIKMRKEAQKLTGRRTGVLARLPAPDYGKISDALDQDPFNPPKKRRR